MSFLLSFCIMVLLFSTAGAGEIQNESVPVEVEGTGAGREEALKDAGVMALNRLGVSIRQEASVKNGALWFSLIDKQAGGVIIEEEYEWEDAKPADPNRRNPVFIYKVKLKARLYPDKGKDNTYTFIEPPGGILNKTRFVEGEEGDISLKFSVSRDSYITIFSIASDDSATVLYPYPDRVINWYNNNRFLRAKETFTFPHPEDRIPLTVMPLKTGIERVEEYILITATKSDHDLTGGCAYADKENPAYANKTCSLKDIVKKWLKIDRNQRIRKIVAYETVGKNR